jgi:iron complex outermembrane receptor protein
MVYGRYGADHTPGGFNDRAVSVESAGHYETTTTHTVELGLKSHWLDNRLRLNMAFYNSYQRDKAEYYPERLSTGVIEYVYDNIAEVDVRGFDLELEYVVTNNLYLRGSWGHINADYTRYEITDLTVPGTILDVERDPERAPANTFYVNSLYTIPYRTGAFNIYLGYQYFDEYRTDLDLPIGLVRTFSTWDASIEYQWQDYTVRLFSQNLNDKRFIVNANRTFDAQFVTVPQTATAVQGITTVADVNRPRYTGIELVWQPEL